MAASARKGTGNRPKPRPVKVMSCGLSVLLSLTFRTALKVTELTGLKVTVRVQDAPAATLAPQVFALTVNSAGFVPVKVGVFMVKAEVPVLVRVVVSDLVRVVFTVPKFRLAGAIFTVPLVNVTVAMADFVASVTEVAVTATVAGVGTAAGAV